MIKSIKLNNELVNKINSGSIKVIDLVKFLVSLEGITYNKELALENISINMLVVDSHKVESAEVDTWENEIILTLSEAVLTTPEATNKELFKIGTEFYTTIEGKMTIKEYLEQFKMYSVMENNKIFKHEDIQRYINNEELTKAKLERSRLRNIELQEQEKREKELEEKRQQEYNFCYGYTDGKIDIQKAKILKTLNKLVLHEGEWIARKDLIHNLINSDSRVTIYNNTNRHTSKRIDLEYKKLKDKVEYRFFFKENTFIEVTKTEYDYIQYLLDNKLKEVI